MKEGIVAHSLKHFEVGSTLKCGGMLMKVNSSELIKKSEYDPNISWFQIKLSQIDENHI